MEELQMEDEETEEEDEEELEREMEEEDLDDWGEHEFVEDDSEDGLDGMSDLEDLDAVEDGGDFLSDDAQGAEEPEDSEVRGKATAETILGKRKAPPALKREDNRKKAKRRGPRVEVEYEREVAPPAKEMLQTW